MPARATLSIVASAALMTMVGAGLMTWPALAQDALGSGDVLDSGLGASRRNAVRPQEDFRERNAIVTGNVAGGRGFRGSVGYLADSDFRQQLGSNDLFQFRAGAAYSSPELLRLESTLDAIRYGQGVAALEYQRSGAGVMSGAVQQPITTTFGYDELVQARLRLDRANAISGTEYSLDIAAEGRPIGLTTTEQGDPLLYSASPVRGLTLERAMESPLGLGLTSFDLARVRQDMLDQVELGNVRPEDVNVSRAGEAFRTQFADLGASSEAVDATTERNRIATSSSEDYARILQNIAERYSNRDDVDLNVQPQILRELDDRYGTLRSMLTNDRGMPTQQEVTTDRPSPGAGQMTPRGGIETPDFDPRRDPLLPRGDAPGADGEDGVMTDPVTRDEPGLPDDVLVRPDLPPNRTPDPNMGRDPRLPPLPPPSDDAMPQAVPGVILPSKPMTLEEYGIMLRHGERIESFSGDAAGRFGELMASAQQSLNEGQYLTAEQRFERALRFTPGHPLASAGMAHAQLGAGLYLSSALTLRTLFTRHPEMIDAAYAPNLLPPRSRLDEAVNTLRERLEAPADRSSYGLALAYIGRQIGDASMIADGLKAMAAESGNDVLLPLLRTVWQEDDGAADATGEAGESAPAAQPAQPEK